MPTECPRGLYGPNCKNNCSPNCAVSKQCDVITGECIGGCKAGWTNSTCDQSKTGFKLVGQCMFNSGAFQHFVLLVHRKHVTLMHSFVGKKIVKQGQKENNKLIKIKNEKKIYMNIEH